MLHPNAVFDTGIWSDEVLESRAKNYGLTVDEYKRNNILRTTITSHDVANLVLTVCDKGFRKQPALKYLLMVEARGSSSRELIIFLGNSRNIHKKNSVKAS